MGCVQSQEPTPTYAARISATPQVLAMTYARAPDVARMVARAYVPGEALPASSKLLHLVRHGQAAHNVAAEQAKQRGGGKDDRTVFTNEAFFDADLTLIGRRRDARGSAGMQLREHAQHNALPEVAITSPLARAAETAVIALEGLPEVPVIADEGCRERTGLHPCDARKDAKEQAARFPRVDFRAIAPGPDAYHDPARRETEEELVQRGRGFFWSLRERPEKIIAVFTHSSFLRNTFSHGIDAPQELRERFANGELRSVVLTYHE